MDSEVNLKKEIPFLKSLLLMIAVLGIFILSAWVDHKEIYVADNTSSVGIVVDKTYEDTHTTKYGVRFFVTIERATVNYFGEEATVKRTRRVDYEDWCQIDVGDSVTYNEDGSVIFRKPSP